MKPSSALRLSDFPRRFPYPRRIWYPSATMWEGSTYSVRNSILAVFLLGVFTWKVILPIGFYYEIHYQAPTRPTMYMRFNRQYKDDPYGEKMFAGQKRYEPMQDEH
ncbi:hypothetical protein BDY24DRAFT_373052 [Mrakia frigida]|uniref:uncharacterized protein n=1 Tax=Mrakia frigida TaxID=29902 RepID=UPI003FCBF3CC